MGHKSASTVVCALGARSAVVDQSASTVVYALDARSAVGHKSASTVVCALSARSAVVHQHASTVVSALSARSAVVHQSASTVVGAESARSAVGHKSASTVVSALGARSAAGAQSASTVVSALGARSAVGLESASTVVCALGAGSAVVAAFCEHGRRRSRVQGVRVEQMTSVVKRRTNRDSAIAPRFIVNFYQLYRLLDRRRQPRASPPPVPPPSSSFSSLLLSQPLPGQLILAAPAALRRLTSHDRPERHTRGHPASFARSLPDPHLPSPQRIAPLIRGDPAGSGRHRERLALVVGAIALELLASDGHR